MSEAPPELGGLRTTTAPAAPPVTATGARELFVRRAAREGRSVALLRALDYGDACVVEAEVWPEGAVESVPAGPYTFADAHQATAFVTEAVEALMYLGCEIYAR